MVSFTAFTKKQVMAEVEKDGLQLQNAFEAYYVTGAKQPNLLYPEDYRSDKEIVLAAVKQNPLALAFASDPLKRDEDVVKAAVWHNPDTLKLASSELQKSTQMQAIQVLSSMSQMLAYTLKYMASCRDIIIAIAVGATVSAAIFSLSIPAIPSALCGLGIAASVHGLFFSETTNNSMASNHQPGGTSMPLHPQGT